MKLDPRERALLIEATLSAFRPRLPDGGAAHHPAWHDLDEDGRRAAFEETLRARTIEAALDPQGLTSTAHNVLSRIRARG